MKRLWLVMCAAALLLGATGAAMADPTVTTYEYNLGTTEWTTTTAAVGSSSLQLNNPVAGGINYAGVSVTNLGDPKVKDFAGWDYWTRGPQFHGANVRMWLDTSYDNYPGGDWDVALNIMPYNMMGDQTIPDDTWVQLDSSSPYPYQFFAWDSSGTYLGGHDISMWDPNPDNMTTWAEFQAMTSVYAHVDWGTWDYTYDFSEAIIKRISIRTGGGGIITDVTAYLDDFTLNGGLVTVEDGFDVAAAVPVPGALLLGAIGLGMVGWMKRRSSRKRLA